ncbi:MAG: DinB superfamily protein, partial [Cyclobacteriaceae bacterium]|nr:DinB superfamily protein [Cyclobacteriaceae bacterium]
MSSFILSIQKIIDRYLTALEKELALYSPEGLIWATMGDVKNSAGNLSLHLCGNLQHYIGVVFGNSGYSRNSENEFAAQGIKR